MKPKTCKIINNEIIRDIYKSCTHYKKECILCDICVRCCPNLHCKFDKAECYTAEQAQRLIKQRDRVLINNLNQRLKRKHKEQENGK